MRSSSFTDVASICPGDRYDLLLRSVTISNRDIRVERRLLHALVEYCTLLLLSSYRVCLFSLFVSLAMLVQSLSHLRYSVVSLTFENNDNNEGEHASKQALTLFVTTFHYESRRFNDDLSHTHQASWKCCEIVSGKDGAVLLMTILYSIYIWCALFNAIDGSACYTTCPNR